MNSPLPLDWLRHAAALQKQNERKLIPPAPGPVEPGLTHRKDNRMSYFSELDAWLSELVPEPAVRKEIEKKVLESFRNGQKACPKCNPRRQQVPREKAPAPA